MTHTTPVFAAIGKSAGFLAAAVFAAVSLIAAEQALANPRDEMAKIDANKDGNISREEAAKHPRLMKAFDQIDTNKDGQLSKAEREAFAKTHKGDGLKRVDTDGNGNISRAEAAKHPRLNEHFDKIDTNKDGQLSADELKAFRAAHGEHGKK